MNSIIKRIPRLQLNPSLVVPVLAALGIALAVACGSSATATPAPRPTSTPADPTAITPILATTVLEVGVQRVAFLLTTSKGLIKAPIALVTPVYLDGDGTPGETMEAAFNLWPYGVRGSYSTYANFDRAGRGRLDNPVDRRCK